MSSSNPSDGDNGKLANGLNNIALDKSKEKEVDEDLAEMDDKDMELLESEIDHLNTALDQIENWSNSLHGKVSDLLKETRDQNKNATQAKDTQAEK